MTAFDLIVRNARLPDGRFLDIGVRQGRIAAAERGLPAGSPAIPPTGDATHEENRQARLT